MNTTIQEMQILIDKLLTKIRNTEHQYHLALTRLSAANEQLDLIEAAIADIQCSRDDPEH